MSLGSGTSSSMCYPWQDGSWGSQAAASDSKCCTCISFMFGCRDEEPQQPMAEMEMHSPHLRGGGENCRNHGNKVNPKHLETDAATPNTGRSPAGLQDFVQHWRVVFLPSLNVEMIHWLDLLHRSASVSCSPSKAWLFPGRLMIAEPERMIWDSSADRGKSYNCHLCQRTCASI